jgi:DNA-directed RNA polymerase specialized sigma24 family protein
MCSRPTGGESPVTASELLAVLAGDIAIARVVYERSLPTLRRLARRHAPTLPGDLHLEIVQETWHLVVARHDEALLCSGIEGAAYLAMVLRNAVEIVKSKDRPAGTRSRAAAGAVREKVVELAIGAEVAESSRRFEVEDRARQIRLDVERFMGNVEPPVKAAVKLMLDQGMTMSNAAAEVGISRQTLGRRLRGLRSAA